MSLSPFTRLVPASYALVIDDHPLVAQGLADFIGLHPGITSARHAFDAVEALRVVASHGSPILALVDFWLADGPATPLVDKLLAMSPRSRVLVVSEDDHPAIALKARASGAHGFIHKREPPETFHAAVTALLRGDVWFDSCTTTLDAGPFNGPAGPLDIQLAPADLGLTPRQGDILMRVLDGMPNKPIANALHLSEHTVKEHLTAILQKLGARNRVELIAKLRGVRVGED
ncbi:LuxR C-terminal-related transcriptional regulator [Paracidovorax cattleyae]|nr:response regulator transcription factor [Paracidovorax cattleyae]MBF9265267.1 response regulator transcription factor [Paracidovorax cattleyae]